MNRFIYILKRFALAIPVLLFGLTMSFLIMYKGPIDPVLSILGRDANPEAARQLRISLGIIRPNGTPIPLWEQYGMVLRDLVTFQFGQSWIIQRGASVQSVILGRMAPTLWLGWWSVVIALLIGIPVGLYAGLKANTWGDYVASGGGIIWRAMPNFWLAVMIAGSLSAGGVLSWYRAFGVNTDVIGTPAAVRQLFTVIDPFGAAPIIGLVIIPIPNVENFIIAFKWILPAALVLGSASMGNEIRIGRTAVLESLNSKYIETAKAKGLSARRIIIKHVGRNAIVPLLPVIMGEFYLLIGGSVLVEQVFSINGLGNLFFRAVLGPDIPVVMTLVFVFIIIQVLFNITQDLLYTVVDPRITLEDTEQ
ncbi:ABC transporter permease [Haloquadratum walsbyi]|jgi:peptide/nickel transport system permease protein|uniref:ABC-type dipeptide/oligopeptide/nickel transport system, permease protein I n=2 Tax=Halobacteriales TaxID=2235 RepID=A5YT47_9EURY|nr:ABC transporter permease [Haloquadratum walsbyi]ABQ76154.1 ABC-type dipeptide/oligopeptide/nickel transport system, permease protein I [uncultured haloarchaeon]CCC39525.1 ABC-type transport system permease protein (probable substrate dipeptide/oligopeptide) [Haloquadratum walsbyi C23]